MELEFLTLVDLYFLFTDLFCLKESQFVYPDDVTVLSVVADLQVEGTQICRNDTTKGKAHLDC